MKLDVQSVAGGNYECLVFRGINCFQRAESSFPSLKKKNFSLLQRRRENHVARDDQPPCERFISFIFLSCVSRINPCSRTVIVDDGRVSHEISFADIEMKGVWGNIFAIRGRMRGKNVELFVDWNLKSLRKFLVHLR